MLSISLNLFRFFSAEFLEEGGVGLLGEKVVSALGGEGIKHGSDFLEGNPSSKRISLVPPVGMNDSVCGVEQLFT